MGSSQRCYDYRRLHLSLQGRTVVKAAIEDPENLLLFPSFEPAEELTYVTMKEYERRHGRETALAGMRGQDLKLDFEPASGKGYPITTVTELQSKFPKLTRTYWGKWRLQSPIYSNTPVFIDGDSQPMKEGR